jgi:hypothetical protein
MTVASLTDDSIGIIYNHNVYIMQATSQTYKIGLVKKFGLNKITLTYLATASITKMFIILTNGKINYDVYS